MHIFTVYVCILFITYIQSCFCQGSGEDLLVVYFVLVDSCYTIIQSMCYWMNDQSRSGTSCCLHVIG